MEVYELSARGTPQFDNLNDDILEKYLPWSEKLPDEILNYKCTDPDIIEKYKDLTVVSECE